MAKSVGIVCLLSFLTVVSFAQDIIIKRNGDEIKSRIEEISQNEIKYKKFENLEGPSYSMDKSEVFIIKYSNGTKEIISSTTSTPVQPNTPSPSYSTTYNTPVTSAPVKARIEGEGWRYYQEGRTLSESSLTRILKEAKNEDAIKALQEGKSLRSLGKTLTAIGIPLMIAAPTAVLIGAAVISIYNSSVDSYNGSTYGTKPDISTYNTGNTLMGVGYVMFGTGLTSVITGGVIKGKSKKKYLQATEMYNAKL